MKLSRLIILAATFIAPLLAADIDFTPHLRNAIAEGSQVRSIYFTDGVKRFGLSLGLETEASANNNGARFTFQKLPDASFRLEPMTPQHALPVTPALLPSVRKALVERLPSGVADLKIVEEIENPLPINQWKTHRFIFSYLQSGRRIHEADTLLTMESGQQVFLQTVAPESEFVKALEQSDYLIRTWHTIVSDNEKAAPASN